MFGLTIRDVLWLTVLAAALVTWWIDREQVKKRYERDQRVMDGYREFGMDLEPLLSELKKRQRSRNGN